MGVTYQQRLEKENIRKREMRVIDKEKEYRAEAKQLLRKLEALNKLRAKNTVPGSDNSESSEDEKAKQKRMKAKEKEKADATKKMVRFGASSSDSEESEDEKAERKKRKAKKREETIMAKKTEVSSSDSSS